jgi:hypothetical protein
MNSIKKFFVQAITLVLRAAQASADARAKQIIRGS